MTQPHSRTWPTKIRYWLMSDPPFVWGDHTRLARVKFWIARFIRFCWRWRDVSPGPLFIAVAWLWGHSPIRLLPFPRLPLWGLVIVGAGLSVWSIHFDSTRGHTANKDRHFTKFKRQLQKAALDAEFRHIPALKSFDDKPHITWLWVEYIEGTDALEMYRKITRRFATIYKKRVTFHPQHDGTAGIAIHKFDPLVDEPALPAHLGNHAGPDLAPTCHHLPIGVDADGDPFTIRLFEKSLLVVGSSGSGKSTSIEAIVFSLLASPNSEPWVIDPQDVSFAAVRRLIPYACDPLGALDLLRDFHTSMKKREIEMAEVGTSLAIPGAKWPFRILVVDEFLRFFDKVELGKDYVDEFQSKLRDVLSTGRKTGHSIIALATDPYSSLLEDGLKSKFTLTLCFRTRDLNATKVGVGQAPPGFRPHELPSGQPGRCVLMGEDKWHQLRTYRVWDASAERARKVAVSSDPQSSAPGESVAQAAAGSQNHLTQVDGSVLLSNPPIRRPRRRDARRSELLAFCQQHARWSFAEMSAELDIPDKTCRYWFFDPKCTNRISVEAFGGGVYGLAGGAR